MRGSNFSSLPYEDIITYIIYMDSSSPPAIEGQIVSDSPDVPDSVSVLFNLENLIKTHISSLDIRKQELKKSKEMLTDGFSGDPAYREQEAVLKAEMKKKAQIKSQLMTAPGLMELSIKVKNLSADVKELNGALSDYLREYARLSGVNEITDDAGEVHEIIYLAKLLKKSSGKFGR